MALQRCLIRHLFTIKLNEVNTAQKLICVSKQETQLYCSDLTGEEDREEEEEEEEEGEEVEKWQAESLFFQLWRRRRTSLLHFQGFWFGATVSHHIERRNKKGGRT